MAKRQQSPKTAAKAKRKERPKTPQNADSLENIANSLISMAGRLKAMAADIRLANFDTMQVGSFKRLVLGKNHINSFMTACIKALSLPASAAPRSER